MEGLTDHYHQERDFEGKLFTSRIILGDVYHRKLGSERCYFVWERLRLRIGTYVLGRSCGVPLSKLLFRDPVTRDRLP